MNRKTILAALALVCAAFAVVFAYSQPSKPPQTLKAFSSDGCTLFPDSDLITKVDWSDCCLEHDIAYWKGGTSEQRKAADITLKQCVLQKTGDEILAELMYEGVRFGGSPYFYNWYRWGYGWDFDRKYQQLSDLEWQQAERLLKEYYEGL